MIIESAQQYEQELKRSQAYKQLVLEIRGVLGTATSFSGTLSRWDMTSVAPLNDAISNLEYDRKQIVAELADWEAREEYESVA